MDYAYNSTKFRTFYGDITELCVDGIAVPSSPMLRMDGGIACKIKEKGGNLIEDEAVSHGIAEPGTVVVTSGGKLLAKNVFHCVLLDENRQASPDNLRRCMVNCCKEAHFRGLEKLAFPALGSAFPGLSPRISTQIIVAETKDFVAGEKCFEEIVFAVCDPAPYRYFNRAMKSQFR
ncbi:MAG: macro domain-containing protein [Candidatus Methanofastidiosia archaeon]